VAEHLSADQKHAPGPWTVGSPNGEGYDVGIHGAEDEGGLQFIIADMCNDGYDPDVQAANARLIAAAPDLYAVLLEAMSQGINRELGDILGDEWRDAAEAALEKVRG
jgi:hypothetical protein